MEAMTLPHHLIDPGLDSELQNFASQSWNAERAIFCLQSLTNLLPRYEDNLEWMEERDLCAPDLRALWSIAADLVSAITGRPSEMATLEMLGFSVSPGILTQGNAQQKIENPTIKVVKGFEF